FEACPTSALDTILMGLNYQRDTTSGQEGIDLLSRAQAVDSKLPVVVMTAWGSMQLAVEAMRRGAWLPPPVARFPRRSLRRQAACYPQPARGRADQCLPDRK